MSNEPSEESMASMAVPPPIVAERSRQWVRREQEGRCSGLLTCGGCAKTWVLAVLVVGVGSCYEDSAGCVVVVVGEPVGDAA